MSPGKALLRACVSTSGCGSRRSADTHLAGLGVVHLPRPDRALREAAFHLDEELVRRIYCGEHLPVGTARVWRILRGEHLATATQKDVLEVQAPLSVW